MIRAVLAFSALMALQDPASKPSGDESAKVAPEAEARARSLARYNELRDKTPMTAAA